MNETQTQLIIKCLREINDSLEGIANALETENTATVNSDVSNAIVSKVNGSCMIQKPEAIELTFGE